MSKKLFKVLGCCLLVILLATGCRPAPRPVPQDPVAPDQRVQDPVNPATPENPQNQTNRDMLGQDLTIRADNIVNEVVRLEEVRSATVVISDNLALVGVDLSPDIEGEMTTETKRKIEDVVRRTDREIDRVSVSADPEIFDSIENIVRETGRGRPLSGFGREIEDIVRRITPGA